MTLRIDRLEALVAELEAGIEAIDPWELLPPTWAAPLKAAKRIGFNLPDRAKAEALTWLRRLPTAARSDPASADRLASWAVHLIAWLTDQTEIPPPAPPAVGGLELRTPATSPGSDEATA